MNNFVKNVTIGILFVAVICLWTEFAFVDNENDRLNEELHKAHNQYQTLLELGRNERTVLSNRIDSLARTRKTIIKSIKYFPVYIPGKFDSLQSKELFELMMKEYRKFNQ